MISLKTFTARYLFSYSTNSTSSLYASRVSPTSTDADLYLVGVSEKSTEMGLWRDSGSVVSASSLLRRRQCPWYAFCMH